MNFVEGHPCYRVSYCDRDLLHPVVETLVYVGKNLSDSDTEESWYFQDPPSYAKGGSFLESESAEHQIFCFKATELSSMHDLDGLLGELAAVRARQRGG